MGFITLTIESGTKVRFNTNHIVSYWPLGKLTELQTTKGFERVLQSAEELDCLIKELKT